MGGLKRICRILVSIIGGYVLSWVLMESIHRILHARYEQAVKLDPDAAVPHGDAVLILLLIVMWIVFGSLIARFWTAQSRRILEKEQKER